MVVFVGFNPSIRSAETGHHYANPTNRFWSILFQAGLTPHKYAPEEDSHLLDLGYGLTNIVERPTPSAADITREEYAAGREVLGRKIVRYRPQVVCYVGKGVFQEYRKLGDSSFLSCHRTAVDAKQGQQNVPLPSGKQDVFRPGRRREISWGIQEEYVIPGIVDFVAPSSSGLVRMGMEQVVAFYRQLAELISRLQ